jgi:flagellum-specific peptidoglycan hydrolase FlgJ
MNIRDIIKLAHKLDKQGEYKKADIITSRLKDLRLSYDMPKIDMSIESYDTSNDPKDAIDYFVNAASHVINNKKQDKTRAMAEVNRLLELQNEKLPENEQIDKNGEFWSDVMSKLEKQEWWIDAPDYGEINIEEDSKPQDFFDQLSGPAQTASRATGGVVPTSLILALAAQESNYGKSKLAKDHNNYFGIKFPGSGSSDKVTYKTYEYDDSGNKYQIDADFASFKSDIVAGMSALPGFLQRNKRYRKGLELGAKYKESNSMSDLSDMINEVFINAGYSTDKNEPSDLLSIINDYNLTKYDL